MDRKGRIDKSQKTIDSLLNELNKTNISFERLKNEIKTGEAKIFYNEDFNSFFYSFMTDSSFQKKRIKFPLEYNTYDIDSMKDVNLKIKKSEWKFNSF